MQSVPFVSRMPCDRRPSSLLNERIQCALSFPRRSCRYSSSLPVSVLRTALALFVGVGCLDFDLR